MVVLTVQDEEADKIEALDRGADDYVTKPFNTGELLARLRAAMRRADKGKLDEPVFSAGGLVVDLAGRWVTRDGELVKLTVTEYALLRLFVQHAGKVLTHRHIMREVWGPEHEENTQYLRVYMTRLREKLEPDPAKAQRCFSPSPAWDIVSRPERAASSACPLISVFENARAGPRTRGSGAAQSQ